MPATQICTRTSLISNKVQAADGRWLALDGRPLHRAAVAASERYNTRLEALLTARLGVRFTERPDDGGKRPVREIVGVDPRLAQFWSKRRQVITARQEQLAAEFATHARTHAGLRRADAPVRPGDNGHPTAQARAALRARAARRVVG